MVESVLHVFRYHYGKNGDKLKFPLLNQSTDRSPLIPALPIQRFVKHNIAISLLVLLGLCAAAAQNSSGTTAIQPTGEQAGPATDIASARGEIDPAKKADIQRLLELVGSTTLMTNTMDSMMKTIRPLMTNSLPAGEYREKLVDLFFDKFHSLADATKFLEVSAVPLYDKHFSDEEIRGLIKFYETPLGQKAVSVLPQLSTELREAGHKWGENIGRQAMQEVLAEHPDLADALKAAKERSK